MMIVVYALRGIKYWWIRFYRQYGFWGIFLIVVSLAAIGIGLYISYRFYEALKPFLKVAEPGDTLDKDATGMIGDFIGGVVGPILSFVGVLLFFLALRLQSKELGLQIKELAETRSVFTTQQFENTFFNLLQTQQEIRLNLEAEEITRSPNYDNRGHPNGMKQEHKTVKAAAFFELVRRRMMSLHGTIRNTYLAIVNIQSREDITEEEKASRIKQLESELLRNITNEDYASLDNADNFPKVVYKRIFNLYGNSLGHYFRNLYHILSYLSENELTELQQVRKSATNMPYYVKTYNLSNYLDSKQRYKLFEEEEQIRRRYNKYAAFIQAQMSSAELFLLFYNALFFPKMKALIHRFDFLENLNADDLLDTERDKKFYDQFEFAGVKYPAMTLKSKVEFLKI